MLGAHVKIRPAGDYHILGTDIRLDSGKVYDAIPATNQPDYKEREKVFVLTPEGDALLCKGEYEVVSIPIIPGMREIT